MSKTLFWATLLLTFRTSFGSFLDQFALKSQITSFPKKQILLAVRAHIVQAVYIWKFHKTLTCKHHRRYILCYFLCSTASQYLLVPDFCAGIKENLTSTCLIALKLEEELVQPALHNFCKNEFITPVKSFMKHKVCCYFGRAQTSIL